MSGETTLADERRREIERLRALAASIRREHAAYLRERGRRGARSGGSGPG